MIGEFFIDTCLTACCSIKSDRRGYKILFSNMQTIFHWYKLEVPDEKIPIEFKDKLDLVYYFSQWRQKEKCFDFESFASRMSEGRMKNLIPIMKAKIVEVDDEYYDEICRIVLNKKKICELLEGKSAFQQLLEDIDSGSFIDDEEILDKWELQIQETHSNMINLKKQEGIANAESLDVVNDSISPIIERIRYATDKTKSLKTGFDFLKNALVAEGLENRRIYLIGGSSGVGKSTMLMNLIVNATIENKPGEDDPENTYLYITAENLIDESWIRYYCALTGKNHRELIQDVANAKLKADQLPVEEGIVALDKFDNKLQEDVRCKAITQKTNTIFKYVQSKRTTCRDVEAIVDEVASRRGVMLRGVFIDYLDLFSTGKNLELRHELGEITQEFKNIAVNYDCPLVTATQLNREGYKTDVDPSLTQVGESIQKIENSDFVLFLQNAKPPRIRYSYAGGIRTAKHIRASILKNRGGSEGDTVQCVMPILQGEADAFNFKIEQLPKVDIIEGNVDEDDESGCGFMTIDS